MFTPGTRYSLDDLRQAAEVEGTTVTGVSSLISCLPNTFTMRDRQGVTHTFAGIDHTHLVLVGKQESEPTGTPRLDAHRGAHYLYLTGLTTDRVEYPVCPSYVHIHSGLYQGRGGEWIGKGLDGQIPLEALLEWGLETGYITEHGEGHREARRR